MALNGRKPVLNGAGEAPKKPVVPDDAAIDRVMSGAPDYRPETPAGEGRAGKGRARGKGAAMGNKRQITHMISMALLDRVDVAADKFSEARATVINRYVREGLERDGL